MNPSCHRSFDEALLSGYLDGALIQLDQQRVRLHLEDCGECRLLLAELTELRDAARSTRFAVPDLAWDERPRGTLSRLLRGTGWALFLVALTVALVLSLRLLARLGSVGGAIGIGLFAGLALLFVSVLIDRLRIARSDPYREVHK